MNKITELTKEQIDKFPMYVENYVKIGLDGNRINRPEAIKDVHAIQTKILNRSETPVLFFDGPQSAWEAVVFFSSIKLADVYGAKAYLTERFGAQLWEQLTSQVKVKKSKVKLDIDSIKNQKVAFVWPYLTGLFWSGYFAFYDYMNKELGLELTPEYFILRKILGMGLIYPLDEVCIVCEKPVSIKLRNQVLHNENGPAVEYADGFKVYALNGVRMTEHQVMTPAEKINPVDVLKETNAEIRRELIRKVGIERMLSHLKSKTLNKRGNYELLSVELSNDVPDARYLKMVNPSIGVYHMEGVDPSCNTVDEALKWRNSNWFTDADVLT